MVSLIAFTAIGCAPITPLPTGGGVQIPTPSGSSSGSPGGGLPSNGSPGGGLPGGGLPGGGLPGGQPGGGTIPGGSGGAGGSGDPSSYDQLPSGGGLGGGSGSGGEPGGEDGSGGQSDSDGDLGWEDLAGTGGSGDSGGDGWDTSNELPADEQGGNDDSRLEDTERGGGEEDEFEAALEDIDGELLAELEIAKASRPGNDVPTPLDSASTGSGDDGSSAVGTIRPSRPSSIPAPPPPPRRGAENVPEDIPDAKDDDIIARQLREAAMQEQDPDLKEKLWDEYRKYKKS